MVLDHCEVTDCLFEFSYFKSFRDWGNRYERVSFDRAEIEDGSLGHYAGQFLNSTFRKTKFKHVSFINAEIENCHFEGTFNSLEFNASSLENCSFTGKLKNAWFRGGFPLKSDEKKFGKPRKKNRMKNVSFAKAQLLSTTFSDDCDLSTIVLPEEGDYRLYDRWTKRLEKLEKQLEKKNLSDKDRAESRAFMSGASRKNQNWYLCNVDQECRTFGPVINIIVSILDTY